MHRARSCWGDSKALAVSSTPTVIHCLSEPAGKNRPAVSATGGIALRKYPAGGWPGHTVLVRSCVSFGE